MPLSFNLSPRWLLYLENNSFCSQKACTIAQRHKTLRHKTRPNLTETPAKKGETPAKWELARLLGRGILQFELKCRLFGLHNELVDLPFSRFMISLNNRSLILRQRFEIIWVLIWSKPNNIQKTESGSCSTWLLNTGWLALTGQYKFLFPLEALRPVSIWSHWKMCYCMFILAYIKWMRHDHCVTLP